MRRLNVTATFSLGTLLLLCVPAVACAQVYRCTAPDGSVAFQDQPCTHGRQQKILNVPSHPPPGYVPPPPDTAPPPPTNVAVPPPPPPPVRAPPPPPALPVMYACVDVVNGKHYLSARLPPPYFVPLWTLDFPPQSLSQVYGVHGRAGTEPPGWTGRHFHGPPIGAMMTEVQDRCVPAPKAQVCEYLQGEYDKNQHKLRLAMRHAKPPYAKRAKTLGAQLRNCQ